MKVFLLVIIAAIILLWLVYQHVKDNEAEAKEVVDYLLCRRDPDPKEPDLSLEAKDSEEEECSKEQTEKAGDEEDEEGETSKDSENGAGSGSTPKDSENGTEDDSPKDVKTAGGGTEPGSENEAPEDIKEASEAPQKAEQLLYGFLSTQENGDKNLILLGENMMGEIARSRGFISSSDFNDFKVRIGAKRILSAKMEADLTESKIKRANLELGLLSGTAYGQAEYGLRPYIGSPGKTKIIAWMEGGQVKLQAIKTGEKTGVRGMNLDDLPRRGDAFLTSAVEIMYEDGTFDDIEVPGSVLVRKKAHNG